MARLLASSATIVGVRTLIEDFYCGTQIRLVESDADKWCVVRVSDGKRLDGVAVSRKRDRYRFEMV